MYIDYVKSGIVTAAPSDVLLTPGWLHAVAKRVKAIDLSRKKMADVLAGVLFDYTGQIRAFNGDMIAVTPTLIDDEFGENLYWLFDMKRFADRLPKRKPAKRILSRLELLDIYFKLIGAPVVP